MISERFTGLCVCVCVMWLSSRPNTPLTEAHQLMWGILLLKWHNREELACTLGFLGAPRYPRWLVATKGLGFVVLWLFTKVSTTYWYSTFMEHNVKIHVKWTFDVTKSNALTSKLGKHKGTPRISASPIKIVILCTRCLGIIRFYIYSKLHDLHSTWL